MSSYRYTESLSDSVKGGGGFSSLFYAFACPPSLQKGTHTHANLRKEAKKIILGSINQFKNQIPYKR